MYPTSHVLRVALLPMKNTSRGTRPSCPSVCPEKRVEVLKRIKNFKKEGPMEYGLSPNYVILTTEHREEDAITKGDLKMPCNA